MHMQCIKMKDIQKIAENRRKEVCIHIPSQKVLTVNTVYTPVKIYIVGGKNG